jgi:transcriptional regulator with XRE-family HTH domain
MPRTFQDTVQAALRKQSQAKLAERLGCSQQAVSAYAAGTRVPARTRVRTYSRVLRVEPEALAAMLCRARQAQVA